MRLNRAITLQNEMTRRIREVYRETIHFGRTHAEHLERIRSIVWRTDDYKRSPQWLRSYLQGVDHVLFSQLYETGPLFVSREKTPEALPVLEAVSIGTDGRRFRETDDSWLKESTEYKLRLQCVHVWRHQLSLGEFKPW